MFSSLAMKTNLASISLAAELLFSRVARLMPSHVFIINFVLACKDNTNICHYIRVFSVNYRILIALLTKPPSAVLTTKTQWMEKPTRIPCASIAELMWPTATKSALACSVL